MQSNPRLSVNLLVILARTPVNLLAKLTNIRLGGHGGGAYPSSTSSSRSRSSPSPVLEPILRPIAETSRNQGTGYTSRSQGTGYTVRPSVERNTTQEGNITATPLRLSPRRTFLGWYLESRQNNLQYSLVSYYRMLVTVVIWNNSLVLRIYLLSLPRKSEKSVKITRDYWSVLVIYHHEPDYRVILSRVLSLPGKPYENHGTISRESTFHLYFVKVESGFSRNDRNLSR